MITDVSQRWRARRDSYRPAGEPIETSRYEVSPVDLGPARAFVEAHHYSGSWVADRVRVGLHRGPDLVGVAVFSVPMTYRVFDCLTCPVAEAVELGRLVLLDDVPANGESWFLARCFELLRGDGFAGVVSFSDPVRRTDINGRPVFQGHVGTCYQASNAVYLGQRKRRTLRLLPDGTVFSDRAISKVRSKEVGWQYAVRQLESFGAKPPPSTTVEGLRAWLSEALECVTRKLRHAGNHKYAWGLHRRVTRALPASLAYPKFTVNG